MGVGSLRLFPFFSAGAATYFVKAMEREEWESKALGGSFGVWFGLIGLSSASLGPDPGIVWILLIGYFSITTYLTF